VNPWLSGQGQTPVPQSRNRTFNNGLSNGIFDWQFPGKGEEYGYDEAKWWGGFPKEFDASKYKVPDWIIGPFTKYLGNLTPNPDSIQKMSVGTNDYGVGDGIEP